MSRSSAAAFNHAPSTDSTTDASSNQSSVTTAQPTWAEDKNPTRPLPIFRLEEEARRLDLAAVRASEAPRASDGYDEDATVTVSAEENQKLLASVFAAAAAQSADAPVSGTSRIAAQSAHPATDDEPTLDAPAPAPSSPEAVSAMATPRPVRVTARPPALKSLVITRPAPTQPPRAAGATEAVISPAAVMQAPAPVVTAAPAPAAGPVFASVPSPVAFPRPAPALVMSLTAPAPASTPVAFVAPPASGFRPKVTPELARTARELRAAEDRRRSAATFTIRMPKRTVENYVVAGIWAMALSLLAVLMFMATSA